MPFLSLVILTFYLWPLTLTLKLILAMDQTRLPCEFVANPFSGSQDISYTNRKVRQHQKQNFKQFTVCGKNKKVEQTGRQRYRYRKLQTVSYSYQLKLKNFLPSDSRLWRQWQREVRWVGVARGRGTEEWDGWDVWATRIGCVPSDNGVVNVFIIRTSEGGEAAATDSMTI